MQGFLDLALAQVNHAQVKRGIDEGLAAGNVGPGQGLRGRIRVPRTKMAQALPEGPRGVGRLHGQEAIDELARGFLGGRAGGEQAQHLR